MIRELQDTDAVIERLRDLRVAVNDHVPADFDPDAHVRVRIINDPDYTLLVELYVNDRPVALLEVDNADDYELVNNPQWTYHDV